MDLGTLVAAPSAWRGVVVWDLAVGSTVAVAWEASAVAKPKALPCLREPNKVRNRQKSQAPIWSRNRWLHFLDGGRRSYPFRTYSPGPEASDHLTHEQASLLDFGECQSTIKLLPFAASNYRPGASQDAQMLREIGLRDAQR